MIISKHTHPRYFALFKYMFAVSAFLMPIYFAYSIFRKYSIAEAFSSANTLPVLIMIPLFPIVVLISAYLYQNITVTTQGLLVEFLWKDLFIPWNKVLVIKPSYVFWSLPDNKKIYIVLTNALTSFHRCFGLLYGFSVKPGFIIYSTISERESLIETIKKHTKKS